MSFAPSADDATDPETVRTNGRAAGVQVAPESTEVQIRSIPQATSFVPSVDDATEYQEPWLQSGDRRFGELPVRVQVAPESDDVYRPPPTKGSSLETSRPSTV
jgi:hypothetical protein